jgi:TPR repeat protein
MEEAMARFEVEGLDLIEHAAQGGATDALMQLGLMYCSGRDVPLDMI